MCNRKRQERTAENNTKGGIPSNMKSIGLGEVEVIQDRAKKDNQSHRRTQIRGATRVKELRRGKRWSTGVMVVSIPPNVQSCTRGT